VRKWQVTLGTVRRSRSALHFGRRRRRRDGSRAEERLVFLLARFSRSRDGVWKKWRKERGVGKLEQG